jgi:malate/lactate dehydrogenase
MDQDIYLGLPCSVSKKGITILELKLHQEEIKALTESAKILKEHT